MYSSLLKDLKNCTKVIENLEAIKLILKIDDEDHCFMLNRKESSIKNEELKNFLELNSYSLSDIVIKTDAYIKEILNNIPESLERNVCEIIEYDDLWNNYLLRKKDLDIDDFLLSIEKVTKTCKTWLTYLQEEEDRGTESSYSDYSGDSTESSSSDSDEDDEERS